MRKRHEKPAVLKSQHLQSLFTHHQSAWLIKRQRFAESHKPKTSIHTLQVRGRFLPVGTKQRAEGAQAGHGNQTQSPQEPGSAQGSSVWNVLNRRRLQSCHTLAKLHCYFKRSVYLPYRIYRAHWGMQTPPEICYRSRTKPSPFLTPKNVFHTKAMLLITIFFLKWPTRRVSHVPPIDSNESLMVRTATAFSRTWWVEATSILIGQE